MLVAIVWGLIQGLTEFLPVSSSGHLIIVPAFLAELGVDIAPPSLAVSAVLHLGTLTAVVVYFGADLAKALRFRTDPEGRRLLILVLIGTLPVLIGLPLEGRLEQFQETVSNVGWALIATGVILALGQWAARGARTIAEARVPDALIIGVAQAFALIPGVSRSGTTIAAGNARGLDPSQAARFSFLLGVPAIAGAGLLQIPDLAADGTLGWDLLVGFITAALSGYGAIALLLAMIRRVGLLPFSAYTLIVGALTVTLL